MELGQVLGALPPIVDPNVLHGAAARDDAAVYRIAPDRALVATVDFFTPIVDDPSAYGAIAAANALSDVYAVGARPLFALGITAFPRGKLGAGLLEKIVSGGAAKLAEAGVPVVGGHSVDDQEPKFGYAVIGEVHPDRVIGHDGAHAGDVLFLTKPLGSGLVATAIYTFILAWDEYLYALTMISTATMRTLPVGLFAYFSEGVPDWSGLTATAIAMSIPVVLVFLTLQRYFITALTKGALKY